jgi:GNAT superfamily N-acetyltransferase
MLIFKRTSSDDLDFQKLIILLDQDLKVRNGDEDAFYAQYNKIDKIKNVVLCYFQSKPVGCGAFKEFNLTTVEIKRMFVLPEFRKKGIAGRILEELEVWAVELNFEVCVLETGLMQPEAIGLYHKSGYANIPNYGPYENAINSVCMKKLIR